uniref:Uncharacterized protein n=1 Tax=Ceratitis capitata TaxID=7213 RepID=W8BFF2_CERCA
MQYLMDECEGKMHYIRMAVSKINRKQSQTPSAFCNLKVEDIKISPFYGDLSQWPTFKDIFNSLIHENSQFSKVEKMYRLKSYLKDEAGRLIQHLTVTNEDYLAAWEILNNRYENRRLLFTSQFDKILDLPTINSESETSLKGCLDKSRECIFAIKGLGINLSEAEPFLARIIVRKLDKEGLRLYEQSVKKTREIQTLEDVFNFLEQQYLALEAVSGKTLSGNKFQKREKSFTNIYVNSTRNVEQVSCAYCKIPGHKITYCKKFKFLTTTQRREFVTKAKLCFVCMEHYYSSKCNIPEKSALNVVLSITFCCMMNINRKKSKNRKHW